jgi:uncharacterized membrane protein HdeD (DUF308 family)
MIVLGAAIVAAPNLVFGAIVNILSLIFLVCGVFSLLKNWRMQRQGLVTAGYGPGIALLIGALLVESLSGMVISMLPALAGFALIMYGVAMISGARSNRQYVNESVVWPTIYGVLVLFAGAFLLFHPFGTAMFLFRVLGAVLAVMGVMELINWFKYR